MQRRIDALLRDGGGDGHDVPRRTLGRQREGGLDGVGLGVHDHVLGLEALDEELRRRRHRRARPPSARRRCRPSGDQSSPSWLVPRGGVAVGVQAEHEHGDARVRHRLQHGPDRDLTLVVQAELELDEVGLVAPPAGVDGVATAGSASGRSCLGRRRRSPSRRRSRRRSTTCPTPAARASARRPPSPRAHPPPLWWSSPRPRRPARPRRPRCSRLPAAARPVRCPVIRRTCPPGGGP